MDGFPSISIQKKMRDMSLIPLMENYLKNAWMHDGFHVGFDPPFHDIQTVPKE